MQDQLTARITHKSKARTVKDQKTFSTFAKTMKHPSNITSKEHREAHREACTPDDQYYCEHCEADTRSETHNCIECGEEITEETCKMNQGKCAKCVSFVDFKFTKAQESEKQTAAVFFTFGEVHARRDALNSL